MSILDSPFNSISELDQICASAIPLVDAALQRRDFTPAQRKVAELMREGFSIAEILNFTQEERDAIFAVGCRLLKVGDAKRAQSLFFTLLQMEPSDKKVIYGLAGCCQALGDFKAAAQLYLIFVAFDATNPLGYLRLGECCLAAKEFENALANFSLALTEAERAGSQMRTIEYARQKKAECEALVADATATLPTDSTT